MCDGCWNCAHACELEQDIRVDGGNTSSGHKSVMYICVLDRDERGMDGKVFVVGDYDRCEEWVSV